MQIVFDTNVLSELRLPVPEPAVMRWFDAIDPEQAATASFTVAEVHYGIAALKARGPVFAGQLQVWAQTLVDTTPILPLNARAGVILGQMLANPALRPIAVPPSRARRLRFGGDLIIAATALAHDACVATRAIADFTLIAAHWPDLSLYAAGGRWWPKLGGCTRPMGVKTGLLVAFPSWPGLSRPSLPAPAATMARTSRAMTG